MKRHHRLASFALIALAIGVASCSGKKEAAAPLNETGATAGTEDNGLDNAAATTNAGLDGNSDTPRISDAQARSEPVPNPDAPPPSDGPGPSAQVRDDADASGMTARIPQDDGTQPVDKSAEGKQ